MDYDIYKMSEKYNLSETENQVLEYILNNINLVLNQGVREIAATNYTSAAAIIKMAKKMGFTGYVDMVYRLNFMLENSIRRQQGESGITSFIMEMDPSVMEDVIALLEKHRHHTIFITATGFSAPIADYITRKMLVKGLRCINTNSYEVYDTNQIDGELVVAISKTGETDSITKVIDFADKNKLDILSFTGEEANHISRKSTVNVPVLDDRALDDRNLTSNYFYARVLILFEYIMEKLVHNES